MELIAVSTLLSPLTGLTPSWSSYYNVATGVSLLTAAPSIKEQASGFYRFNEDVSAQFTGVVDMGAAALARYRLYLGDGQLAVVMAISATTGAPLAGLTPTWYALYNVNAGRAATAGETPSFTELGGGLYKFTPTTSIHLVGWVDFGATASPRYVSVDTSGAGPAATSTDFWTIRDNMIALIEALSPTYLAEAARKFRRVQPRSVPIRDFAETAASSSFRKFDIVRKEADVGGSDQETGRILDPTLIERVEHALITVAYPVLPGLYGSNDLDDMEKVIRSDAHQIRDVVFDPGNYLGGQSLAYVTINAIEKTPTVWFQPFSVELTYLEAQNLGG